MLISFVWLFGLGFALIDYYGNNGSAEMPIKQESEVTEANVESNLTIVTLGDSLTRGTGDVSGKGYVGYVKESLAEETDQPITLFNLGISGQRSNELVQQVKQKEVTRQLQKADVVMITIGGNDLFQGGQSLMNKDAEKIAEIEANYLENLQAILQQIRSANNDASIFLIGLYNPFSDLKDGKEISSIVREWNYKSAETAAVFSKVVFVPTFDLFELQVNDYLYSDKFHPNQEGHQIIAERVSSLITW